MIANMNVQPCLTICAPGQYLAVTFDDVARDIVS